MKKRTTIHKAFGLDREFYIGSNATAQDDTLSFELVGVIAYLSSLPDDWEINASNLQRAGTGKNKTYKLIRALVERGFMRRVTERNDAGQIRNVRYEFYAIPERNPDHNPLPENHDHDNHDYDNRGLQSKHTKKEKNKQTVPRAVRDAIFNVVALRMFSVDVDAVNSDAVRQIAPRISMCVNEFIRADVADAAQVEQFVAWYGQAHPNQNLPRDPKKLAEYLLEWASAGVAPNSNGASLPTVPTIIDYED